MPAYVIGVGKLAYEGRTYLPGEEIDLPEEFAEGLPQGRVVPLWKVKAPEERGYAPPEESIQNEETGDEEIKKAPAKKPAKKK